jgi:hypothetical protein
MLMCIYHFTINILFQDNTEGSNVLNLAIKTTFVALELTPVGDFVVLSRDPGRSQMARGRLARSRTAQHTQRAQMPNDTALRESISTPYFPQRSMNTIPQHFNSLAHSHIFSRHLGLSLFFGSTSISHETHHHELAIFRTGSGLPRANRAP